MKASDLEKMIRKIVAEEVRKAIPTVLSEMFLRKIVSESVNVTQKKQNNSSLSSLEWLNEENEPELQQRKIADPHPVQKPTMTREQLRAKFKSALVDPDVNPLAELYEGTMPIDSQDSIVSDGVSLDDLPRTDYSKFMEQMPDRQKVQETEAMVQRKLEAHRRKLDEIKVG